MKSSLLCTAILLGLASCSAGEPPVAKYNIVQSFPHDGAAFCQGFLVHEGKFYEGTGRYGTSSVRRVDMETGSVEARQDLPSHLFGEGIAIFGDELFQLTWKAGTVHIYDLATMEPKRKLTYSGDGWGLTSDGKSLIRSDGTDTLYFHDPKDFAEQRRIRVNLDGAEVREINEMEYVEGEIWANVWKKEYIVRISPKNGNVLGWIDLRGLFDVNSVADPDSVLNGIAWDAGAKKLYVTGKLWPEVFELKVVEP